MGSGTSRPVTNNDSQKRSAKKSIRGEFQKEFGTLNNNAGNEEGIDVVSSHVNKDTIKADSSAQLMTMNPALFKAKRLFMKPLDGKKPKDNYVIKKQDNNALLKEMFRRMDPSVTTMSAQVIVGQIELAVKYNLWEKSLLVKIVRAKDLEKEGIGFPDPYVSIDLFSQKDPTNLVTRKTAVKPNTITPVFQEILVFPLREKEIAEMKLRIGVWDKDRLTQDDFLGESIIELCQLDLNVGNVMWYKLHPKTDISISGSVDITLTFEDPNKLQITIHQGYDLKACIGNTSNPYIRLYVTGIPNKEETKVIESTIEPEWNESFDFTVHPDEFSRRIIVITVLSKEEQVKGGRHHKKRCRDKRLGDVHIPLIDFDFEAHTSIRRNYNLQDLRNTPHTRSKWSEEGLSIEFKEAMKAHATYGYPKFFFQKVHHGKKVVSCRSSQARCEARMIINNGIPSADAVQM